MSSQCAGGEGWGGGDLPLWSTVSFKASDGRCCPFCPTPSPSYSDHSRPAHQQSRPIARITAKQAQRVRKQTQRRSVLLAADKINTGANTAGMILIRRLAPTAKCTDERQFHPTCFPQLRMRHENNSKPNTSSRRQNTAARAWWRPARCEPSQESG